MKILGKIQRVTGAGFAIAILALLLCGCNNKPQAQVSKTESEMIHKPLGQPMPPEAQAAMQKAMQRKGSSAPAPTTP